MAVTSSVFLNVNNIEKSLEWYRNMGFRVARTYKDDEGKVAWADLSLQGAEFGLGHIPSNDDPAFRQWVSTPLGAGVIVYFTVPNVDRYYKLAQDVKADIEQHVTERPYGRMFTVNDIDGYTLSFITEERKARARPAAAKTTARRGKPAKRGTARKTAKGSARRTTRPSK